MSTVINMKHRFGAAVAATALGLAGLFVPGAVAAAEPAGDVGALDLSIWLYEHDDLGGDVVGFSGDDRNLANNSWLGKPGRIANNNASSMLNNSSRYVILYDTANTTGGACRGLAYTAQPTSQDDDFTNNSFDNKASCVEFQ
jgi:hypothetical protein